jgi:hypothetical protein
MRIVFLAAFVFLFASLSPAQSGGTFDLSHNVIAGGGEMRSAGGQFIVDGTVGQPLAGTTSFGGRFELLGGFWSYLPPLPTAASVVLGGHIDLGSHGPQKVDITLVQLSTGRQHVARLDRDGNYRFDELEIGIYLVRPESSNYQFTPAQLVIDLIEDRPDINFTAVRIHGR